MPFDEVRLSSNPASAIPSEFDVGAILSHVEHEHCVINQDEYNVLFEQYLRFDVSSQLPYFYRSVQKMFGALCTKLVAALRRTVVEHLSPTSFDPVFIHCGSHDRSVDALMGTCAVLTSHGLINSDDGSAVLLQYREVGSFFKKKWSLHRSLPVIDKIIDLWVAYPFRARGKELRPVVDVVFGLVVSGQYSLDFTDDAPVAIPRDTLMSSLHMVRSWLQTSFADQTRKNLQGLIRLCRTTHMQVSRLTDTEPAVPWEQLLKSGLDVALTRCLAVYDSSTPALLCTSL